MAQNKQQDALKAELKLMLKQPDNARCADCNTQGPTWASTNLGIFVCMRCSGIHRSLGTHISKVKSTVLDNWQPSMVARMASVGNRVGKEIYEHGVPANYPRNFTDQHQLVSWIRNKYEFKKWFNASADPDLAGDDSEDDTVAPLSNTQATSHAQNNAHAQSQIRFSSAPTTPVFHEGDLFASQTQNAKPTSTTPAFGDFTSHQSHGVQGDLFAQLAPSHAHIGSSISLPSTPVSHNSNTGSADLFHTAPNGIPPEQDLFKMHIGPSASTAQSTTSAAPKPVDKTLLMNAYNNTPFGVQHPQQQQQQHYHLQQQAFLQQQQLFNQQMFGQQAFSPQLAFGAHGSPAAQPMGQWNPAQQGNLFAPQPQHSAGHSQFSGHPSTGMGVGASHSAPAQPQTTNGSILASLYAQSPQFAAPTSSPMYPGSGLGNGVVNSPIHAPMSQPSLI